MTKATVARIIGLILVITLASIAFSQPIQIPNIQIGVGQAKNQGELSTSLQILAMLTVLSIAPAILILTTAFTRIVIILSFVRTALGTQAIPPNQVIVGLSLFMTFFVMGPTFDRVNKEAIAPYMAKKNPISYEKAIARAQVPVKDFMLKNTYEGDLKMFLEIRKQAPRNREELDIMSLIPAFVISELKTAFIIGFYIFVPFVIIDLIVASVLMGMGMMMMPPVVVSLPAKLLVFVLADGWAVLAHSILSGYG